ncbi:hypothetical protein PQR39_45370, partial [Paraburkholderia sediminicola]
MNAYRAITEDAKLGELVQALLKDLVSSEQHEPFPQGEMQGDYIELLRSKVLLWARDHGIDTTVRFAG